MHEPIWIYQLLVYQSVYCVKTLKNEDLVCINFIHELLETLKESRPG